MSGNITGTATIISNMTFASYSFSWSGTSPVGTVSIQVSNDYALSATGQVANAGTWNTLPLSYSGSSVTTVPLSGNTGNGFIDIDSSAGYAIRPVYTFASGVGSLQCKVTGKVA
jgi:hypothetical protein